MAPLFTRQRARGSTWLVLCILYCLLPAFLATEGIQEVCQWESFEAQCPDDHVIVMTRAVYGRMRLGKCVQKDLGYLGCQTDVKRIADAKCSGRKKCTITIPDKDLDREKPCSELQNYLEASYQCRKVESLDDTRCHKCDYVRVQNEVGFLASAVTSESGCGSMECPWFISGGQGQYIRLSLIDFSLPDPNNEQFSEMCKVYAVIKERDAQKSATICGGQGRNSEREVYTSHGPELEIRILGKTQGSTNDYFLVKYEVFGCPRMSIEGAKIVYEGLSAKVTCDDVRKSPWTLTCNNTHWKGMTNKNCTVTDDPEIPGQYSADPVFNTTSLIIMAAVALIICTLVVIIGVVCFKICTHSSRPRRSPHSYEEPPDLCHPPPLSHDTYCVTHVPHVSDGTMSLDRCVTSKVSCKTYSFENGQKNEYEHICDSSGARVDFNT